MKDNIELAQLAESTDHASSILVAFSGGLDSTVLLHQLMMLREQQKGRIHLRAMYVHHGLSANADYWAEHCHQICAQWHIAFSVVRVSVNAQQGGIECAARDARYRAFADSLLSEEVLVTAQHLNDQCETFLLALKRGSGPAGLSSMGSKMPFAKTWLYRPLLTHTRTELEEYAQRYELSWIEDESNQDDRFDRNFLRLRVLPTLQHRWPYFLQSVAQSAALCAEQEVLLDELLEQELRLLMDTNHALDIVGLQAASEVKRHALLRRWFARQSYVMPGKPVLLRIWHEVALCREDAEPQLQVGQVQVRRYRQRLYLLPLMTNVQDSILSWSGETPLVLPDGIGTLLCSVVSSSVMPNNSSTFCVRAPNKQEVVSVCFQAKGDVRIVGRSHSRSIKKLWQEFGIPPWLRNRTPLLYYNDTLIAALHTFITQEGAPHDTASAWQLVWQK